MRARYPTAREHAVLGGQPGLGDPLDLPLVGPPVGDEVGDRDQGEVVLVGEAPQVRHPHHGAVVVDQLAEHAGRAQAGQPGQVDRGLGVAGPAQHAAVAGPQRHHVPGAGQVGRPGRRVGQQPDRVRPLGRRDAGRHALAGVHRHRVRGAAAVLVACGTSAAGRAGRRRASVSGAQMKPDVWRTMNAISSVVAICGGEDEVALVLPVLVVDDDHRPAGRDLLDRLLDGGELRSSPCHPPASPRTSRSRRPPGSPARRPPCAPTWSAPAWSGSG